MAKEKDKTEVGITGKPVPKPGSAKKQYELEKKRRMGKHLGKNVGGTQYKSDVNPYFNPRSVREEVISYLLDEGFASDEKSAEAIMGAMGEAWVESIVEGMGLSVGGAKLIGKLASNSRTSEAQATQAAQKNITDPIGFAVKGAAKAVLGTGDEKNKQMMQKRRPN
jgi:hypothetical protein